MHVEHHGMVRLEIAFIHCWVFILRQLLNKYYDQPYLIIESVQ